MSTGETLTTGEKIAHERKKWGWSQGDLGAASGVTQRTVSRIESGEQDAYGFQAKAIAVALGVDVNDLLGEESDLPPRERQREVPRAAKIVWKAAKRIGWEEAAKLLGVEHLIVAPVVERKGVRRGGRKKPIGGNKPANSGDAPSGLVGE